MTNVVVYQKFDLPYRRYGSYVNYVLFKDGRIEQLRKEKLLEILDAQATEITNYLKEANNQN